MRNDGTMYNGFYDRQLVVTVSSEPGSPSSTVPEDKRIIPDDNILNYEVLPGMTDLIIRISVSKLHLIFNFKVNTGFIYVVHLEFMYANHLSDKCNNIEGRGMLNANIVIVLPC